MCDVTTGCKAVDEGLIQMTTNKYEVFFQKYYYDVPF